MKVYIKDNQVIDIINPASKFDVYHPEARVNIISVPDNMNVNMFDFYINGKFIKNEQLGGEVIEDDIPMED